MTQGCSGAWKTVDENGKQRVFNFQLSKIDTKIIKEKLNEVFKKIDSAAKTNAVLGFALRNIGTAEYQNFSSHENSTMFETSQLLRKKADLITIQGKVEKFNFMEQFTQERQNTKWRFILITNLTIFSALLKKIPTGCPESVLPEPLLKNHSVNCLLSNKEKEPKKAYLSLFRALAMYMKGHNDLESHTSS